MPEVQVPRDSLFSPFMLMLQGGVPFSTLIDIGSADGTYSLEFLRILGGQGTICNLDANTAYEPSLAKIKSAVGGHYRICAVSSFNGRVNLSTGKHEYWTTLSGKAGAESTIECRTLDSLREELGLRGPFFIKMDVEGSEHAALLGAERTLAETAGLILEVAIYYGRHVGGTLTDISTFLAARGFSLFDLVSFGYRPSDKVLYQVYAAFLNTRYEFRERSTNVAGIEGALEEVMRRRRQTMLEANERLLADLAAPKPPGA